MKSDFCATMTASEKEEQAMGQRRKGFTLLELLMVVIIIAILAAIAIPQYLKVAERARMSEALSILGALRSSEVRYKAQNGTFTATLVDLDFDATDVSGTPVFTYEGVIGTATDLDIKAIRNPTPAVGGNCEDGYTLHIDEDGVITGQDCQTP